LALRQVTNSSELQSGHIGILTIAAIPALARVLAPKAIQRFRTARPGVSVRLLASAHESATLVTDQRADLALIFGPIVNPDVAVSDLCSARLTCLLPRKHPLAKRAQLHPVDLSGEQIIGLSPHFPIGIQVGRAFAEANVPLRLAIEMTKTAIAVSLVRVGAGIALLDEVALMGGDAGDLVLRPIKPALRIDVRILHPRHRPVTRLAQEFSRILQRVTRDMGFREQRYGAAVE
jgi:DNA-binding transcriptional LysR family regulator